MTSKKLGMDRSKLRKVDKSLDSSTIKKILGSFFDRGKKQTRVVMDIATDERA